jgi:hypothetical protein
VHINTIEGVFSPRAKRKPGKRGPKEERLIMSDPAEALAELLKRPASKKSK